MKFLFSRSFVFSSACLAILMVATILFVAQSVPAQVVDIPDPNLREAIREELKLPSEPPITKQQMLELVHLSAPHSGITNLTGLESATFLLEFDLRYNLITDITPLANLPLSRIGLDGNQIDDISSLANLISLYKIGLSGNQISDLRPLSGLIYLEKLTLDENQITDISPLINLTNLKNLNLSENPMISDITPLANLTQLIDLDLSEQSISDITPLANLTLLEKLQLNDNLITDIHPLIRLTNLKVLHLADNPIGDFSPLVALEGVELDIEIDLNQFNILNLVIAVPDPNLKRAIRDTLSLPETEPLTQGQMLRLLELNAQGKGITDLTGLEYASELQTLRLCDNQIHDLRPLTGLVRLETLTLCANSLNDIYSLASLTQLRALDLSENMIKDIAPLANLTLLEELGLERNEITAINPLIRLENLKTLRLADNPIRHLSSLLALDNVELDIEVDTSQLDPLDLVLAIPDPNLEQAIRETLELSEDSPVTRREMLRLTRLSAWDRGITDLTGLQHAISLIHLSLRYNQIEDLTPIANLIQLEELILHENPIKDLSPLTALVNLKSLALNNIKSISDISILANFTKLEKLNLNGLLISDISPLANLTNLRKLYMYQTTVTDFTPIRHLNLVEFLYDEVCEIPPFLPSARERIESRSFPSVVQVGRIVGLDHLTWEQHSALHDLNWAEMPEISWDITPTEPASGVSTQLAGSLSIAHEFRQQQIDQNPNIVFLLGVEITSYSSDAPFPPDSDFWLRDANDQIIRKHTGSPLINFVKPEVQQLIANRIVGVSRCGFYDGVFLDDFSNNGLNFSGREFHPVSDEEIIQARRNILRMARLQVRDDFLILINANETKPTRYTEFINGILMETGKDYPGGYTRAKIEQLEDVLSWVEQNLREPRINSLEGAGIGIEPTHGPNNLRWMRLFTTLTLTHSDGYVLYTAGLRDLGGNSHVHSWYDFWETDLGRPIGPKARLYQNINGLFIREFTNGWAVYNRSRKAQTISLPESATGVSSGKSGITHILPDLDGEMYLKAPNLADVNGDGKINVLDLVQVANGLGKTTPDPNGDGVVNILDLVFVAQQFSQ